MIVRVLVDTLVTGLPYMLPVIATFVVFRVLGEVDLTVDASFVLGAAVTAVLLRRGVPAPAATAAGLGAGAAAGTVTALLHIMLRVPVLMAGIISMIGFYSLNLRVMGRPSIGLSGLDSLYGPFRTWDSASQDLATIGVLIVIAGAAIAAVALFLRTEAGLALRCWGGGPRMASSYGVDSRTVTVVGLAGANAFCALGGSLVAQGQGFADINMGVGTAMAGVAGLVVGELVLRVRPHRLLASLAGAAVGALVYRCVLVVALRAGLPSTDLRLVTALVLVIVLALQRTRPELLPGAAR